jgi:cytochrome c-type biogenesis protein CcmE
MDIAEKRTLEAARPHSGSRLKFLIGGLLIVSAVVYLVFSTMQSTSQYFLTVSELKARGNEMVGRDVRLSGAVMGDSISYDPETLILRFTIAHTPGDQKEVDAAGGLAAVLHQAVVDPNAAHIQVQYNGVMPDLLRNEAQAIMTGKLGDDGVFYADELLLKCPTKYEDAVPEQAGNGG